MRDPPLLLEVIRSAYTSNPIQKCDAKRPCTACVAAKTVSKCVYDNEECPQPASVYSSHKVDGYLSGQRLTGPDPLEILTPTPSHSSSDGVFGDVSSPTKSDQTPFIPPDATLVAPNEPDDQHVSGANQVPYGELVLAHRNPLGRYVPLDTNTSTFTVSSFFLPTIPPELWVPFSFLGEERLQVQFSEAAAADLVMTA